MKPIIDISYWQPPSEITYDLLAGSISGVILRACYATGKDTRFEQHYNEFARRGIPIGAYHYIVGNVSALGQAEAFRDAVAGKILQLGLWADVEDIRPGTALTRQHVVDYMTAAEDLICNKENGMIDLGNGTAAVIADHNQIDIYTSRAMWAAIMGTGSHPYGSRKLWVANYKVAAPALPVGWTSWWLWQYASDGDLPGYNGNLDMNHFWGSDEQYQEWVGGAIPEPPDEDALYQVEVIAGALNIRPQPNTDNIPLYAVPKGTILDVYEEVGLWLRVGQGKFCSGNSAYVRRVELSLEERVTDLERRVTALEGE